ncbi:MAG: tol-pal system-associated acyl-CoA thioesterase [Rhodospirillaceae bacterium]|nr:tol-pal system-associated acyl-CoA thioesterase [Rhodospirillaceae bacterium]
MVEAMAGAPATDAEPLAVHRHELRVYFEDTDAGGIVYYANYLRFAERARTEMMRDFGATHAAMIEVTGATFAVRRCEVDYLKPARLDDLLEIETAITDIGAATLDARQRVLRGGEELVRIQIRLACMNADGRATRIPATVREALNRNR